MRKPTGQAVYRAGRWVARVILHRLPRGASGKHPTAQRDVVRDGKPVTGRTKADRAHAKRAAERLQGRYDDGSWEPEAPPPPPAPEAPPAGPTVSAWVDSWCAGQGYGEAQRDRAKVKAYLPRTRLGVLLLPEVTPQAVAAWVEELRALPSPKTGAPPAPRTVRNVFDVVRRAFKRAAFDGAIPANPFATIPAEYLPKPLDARPEARAGYRLSLGEVEALVAAAEGRWRVLWALLAMTGARLGEALALRWCDLHEDAPLRRVVIARQVHHRSREVEPTKTRELRVVPEHPALRAALELWRRSGWRAEYGRDPREEDLVVPARGAPGRPWGAADGAGGPLWAGDVDRALKRSLAALGLPAHRVHDLRHTFASLCADAGMREHVAARWTHTPGGASARHLYAVPSWAAQCAEMALLKVNLMPPPVVGARVANGG